VGGYAGGKTNLHERTFLGKKKKGDRATGGEDRGEMENIRKWLQKNRTLIRTRRRNTRSTVGEKPKETPKPRLESLTGGP